MFGGFKASLNFFGGKKNKKDVHSELSPDMCVIGAYRTSRDDFFAYNNSFDQPKKVASDQLLQQMRPTKSSSDLTKANSKNAVPKLRSSVGEVSRDPRGAEQVDPRNGVQRRKESRNQEKEQKRLEKQRLAEQKSREKEAQEQAKQEKLRKEKEKKEVQQSNVKRERRQEKKKQAPQPQASNPVAQRPTQYSTNTLESSISRSSGPPPYSDVPQSDNNLAPNKSDGSGNVIFSKPVDTGSWDMINQHREQYNRPTAKVAGGSKQSKQTVMDLNYNFSSSRQDMGNSEA